MKQILKGPEPRSLTEHRAVAHATYENYADKDALRAVLLEEQGGLCCYCMSRIRAERMKIEHWAAQDTHPERQLDYHNLLGACLGNEGARLSQQHCDTRKGNQAISVHPADSERSCERLLMHLADGTIATAHSDLRRDINEVLNLNVYRLRENRKAAVMAIQEGMHRKHTGNWSRAVLEREIERWRERDMSGAYREHCQVVVFWLEKRLARQM